MTRKKKIISIVVILLYAITWLGGHATHSKKIREHAIKLYDEARLNHQKMSDWAHSEGLEEPQPVRLRKDGPKSEVKWSIPLVPGVLLANSYYVNGPLWVCRELYMA